MVRENVDLNHPDPVPAHLSKAPVGQDIHTYDSSGDWVKDLQVGLGVDQRYEDIDLLARL
jgi:hypothetical protein